MQLTALWYGRCHCQLTRLQHTRKKQKQKWEDSNLHKIHDSVFLDLIEWSGNTPSLPTNPHHLCKTSVLEICAKSLVISFRFVFAFLIAWNLFLITSKNSKTRMAASILKQDPNTWKIKKNAYLIIIIIFVAWKRGLTPKFARFLLA